MQKPTFQILLDEPVGTISPLLYGHFMEHLGGCVDEGCWVGEDSPIAHTGGIRNDVLDALRAIHPPVIRWPGGCYADDYHWEDGIGPRADRPRRVNMHWGHVIERNGFGTHEFIALCRAVGAEPYLAGNLGSGTVREMRDWVEYCNFPSGSTLSDRRAVNGSPEPFGVRYWGVGNENWACGGNFTPEDYGTEYRRYANYLKNWGGTPLTLIACGPNRNDPEWTRRFFEKLKRDFWDVAPIHGFAAHHYSGSASTALEFDDGQWCDILRDANAMEALVVDQRALMDEYDPERKIGLIVDEWGAWHRPTPATNAAFLWQQSTVRDAMVAASTFDIFNRHADKVVMANLAQTINVLQSLILTDGDRMITTPTYHVFDLYQDHMGGNSVRVQADAPESAPGVPQLAGSASVRGDRLTLTVTNASPTEPIEFAVQARGGRLVEFVDARSLAFGGEIRAFNDFDAPDRVRLADRERPSLAEDGFTEVLDPGEIARFSLRLG